ncbi:MAG: hypothetical protein ACI8PG_005242, partial [Planctomycetota bacterium]
MAIKKRERMLRSIYFLLALYTLAGTALQAQDYGSRLGTVKRG